MKRTRLLAVAHEATLTGAPINLLHFLGWVTSNTDIEVHTLLLRDGPLHGQFAEVGEVTALDGPMWRRLVDIEDHRERGKRLWSDRAGQVAQTVEHLGGFNLVYLNSVASLRIVQHLPPSGKTVCHVHELGVALSTLSPVERLTLRTAPDLWIAASNSVKADLVDVMELDPALVRVHHEFIDARRLASMRVDPRAVERLRLEERIPMDCAIVMGAGTLEWRKGADQFVQLAGEVARRTREPIKFLWVGGELRGTEWARLSADCARSGILDAVRFVGSHSDPVPWFCLADVFVLTSHEDPYPLVCLEHAALGHPIVTFRNGGIVELLEPAGELAAAGVVEHLDVPSMATRVLALLESDRIRTGAAKQLQARVTAHHDVGVAAPALFDELQAIIS